MNEDFLHYVWKHRLFNSLHLKTTQQAPLYILSAGVHNMNGGPDFLQARVRIGDQLWVGNVEIHIKASDWRRHGHQTDKYYNTVVLHVVYEDDEPIQLHQPGDLPVLAVAPYINPNQWNNYQMWMNSAKSIPCQARIEEIDAALWISFRDALLVERLEQKSQLVLRQLQRTNGDWNEVYYRLLAKHFGGKVNGETMEMLAERISFALVLKLRSDPFQLNALFYGMAGMLEGELKDAYAVELQKEFNFLRSKYQLPPAQTYHWQFFGLRPAGFPTVRMGQFVDLLARGEGWLDRILELADTNDLTLLFECRAPTYWNESTQFDKTRGQKLKSANGIAVGSDFIKGLLINVVAVVLFAYGRSRDDAFCLQRALIILEGLDVEDNKIIRDWGKLGVRAAHAGDAQAMIQLKNQYCDKKRCLNCRIGVKLLNDTEKEELHARQ